MIRPYLRDLINEHKPIDEPDDDDDGDELSTINAK